MGSVRKFRKMNSPVLGYTPEDIIEFQDHIRNCVGPFGDDVLHDKKNLCGVHIDIVVVWPRHEDPYIHLITMGAGAYLMPDGNRAEFMISLPKDWPMDMESWSDERNYWPIRLLQDAAHFPISKSTSLDWLHTIYHERHYSIDTMQCGCMFMSLPSFEMVQLSSGKTVKILQIVPLYLQEIVRCHMDGNDHVASEIKTYFADANCFVVSPRRALCL